MTKTLGKGCWTGSIYQDFAPRRNPLRSRLHGATELQLYAVQGSRTAAQGALSSEPHSVQRPDQRFPSRPIGSSVRSGKRAVLYNLYQAYADALAPLQSIAQAFGHTIGRSWLGVPETQLQRNIAATCALLAEGRLHHHRPQFGIGHTMLGNRQVAVCEEPVLTMP